MKNKTRITLAAAAAVLYAACTGGSADSALQRSQPNQPMRPTTPDYHGFESAAKWGEHIVAISGCNDCHTQKKMGPKARNGYEPDALGPSSQTPPPLVDLKSQAKASP